MKKNILIIILTILALVIIIYSIFNSDSWDLQSCEEECAHRGYEEGACLWASEIENETSIGSCLVPMSRHCGTKGQCDCYCSNEQIIGLYLDSYGCNLMEGYNWCEAKEKCVRYQEEGCEKNSDCVVFGETGDCNCGCYNKDMMPTSSGGECFCAAPTSCECVDGECVGVF